MVNIKFAKMSVRAIIPTKRQEDVGYDVYADVMEPIVIYPGQTMLIPTSICSVIPDGTCYRSGAGRCGVCNLLRYR